jgi:signal transduction histidine kinase
MTGGPPELQGLLPATAELKERIGWFIRLRWVAVAGVVVFVALGSRFLPVDFHPTPVLSTVALLAAYNGLAFLYYRRLSDPSRHSSPHAESTDQRFPRLAQWLLPRALRGMAYDPEVVRAVYFVNVQMVVDLTFLAALLHFTGGIENPLRMFFLFHVIIAGILLSRRATYLYATVALALMAAVALGEMLGWLSHYSLNAHWRAGGYLDPNLALTQLFLLGTTLYITAYMGSSIGARLRLKELDVFLLGRALEEKAQHLESAIQQVQAAERAKSQYMRKVAHELRGPLGTVQTALAVVLKNLPEGLSRTSLDLIRRAERRAGELAEMTKELLALSRARDGKALAEATLLQPLVVADRVLEEARPRAEEAGLSLSLDLPPSMSQMRGDTEGLTDLLSNLLGNAIRYTPRGGRISFTMREEEGQLMVEVADTGIGIEEEAQARVFDEFYRSEAARANTADGSGLGLAIVKAVVEQHRGTIDVESEVGRGTRFRVSIPMARNG